MDPVDFVNGRFREYYVKNIKRVLAPVQIQKREFAFVPFAKEKKLMLRHKGFDSPERLREFIKALVPSDVYYSSAYYEHPDAENMREKKWKGADLVFDVDCDHIATPCKAKHDSWKCVKCGRLDSGNAPESCPNCSAQRFKEQTWICEECLGKAKGETLKLVSMLEDELGISAKNMTAVFSGHRGYHIHVESISIEGIGGPERKEIVDYITGTGLEPEFQSIREGKFGLLGPAMNESGWPGRLSRGFYELLDKTPEELKTLGVHPVLVKKIMDRQKAIVDSWPSGEGWRLLGRIKLSTIKTALTRIVKSEGAAIDTVVTTDIHRLIRLPNTLHGKTAWKVVTIPLNALEQFDPLSDALAFEDSEKLQVETKSCPAITLGGMLYGPFKDEKTTLPESVALFLISRGKATPL